MDIKENARGVVFKVKAAPNAVKSSLEGEYNGMLKVKVAAAPKKGKANKELVEYLSGRLKVSKSRIEIIKGSTSREKIVSVKGLKKQDILKLTEE